MSLDNTDNSTSSFTASWQYRLFALVKYATYLALCANIYLFLRQETATVAHSVAGDVSGLALIQLFSATLDTAAWVVLLLLFELETAVIPDHRLVGLTRWCIHGVRLICGAAIVGAFLGYWGEWLKLFSAEPLAAAACDQINQGWSIMERFDQFADLTAENCASLGSSPMVLSGLDGVLATGDVFAAAQRLAFVDVLNAAAWILVVIMLEVEVRILEVEHGLPQRLRPAFASLKFLLYATLAAAAVFWGFEGDFLDFWDAALWLFAFVFIELNVFEWQRELRGAQKPHDTA